MKDYPSISSEPVCNELVHVFDKIDGSNIRAEWNPKQGFYKFGSRKVLIGSDAHLGESISLVKEKYAELEKIFRDERYQSAVAFFEFFGSNSFAGIHQNEPHDVLLLDVSPYKKGILIAKEFMKLFGHLPIPQLLMHGYLSQDDIRAIKGGTFPGMTFEGVVCKGRLPRKTDQPLMFKIKNDAWKEKVKLLYAGDEKRILELI